MIVPLRVTRPVSMEAVAKALEADERLCFLVAQRNPLEDEPTAQGFYRAGTIGMIMRMRKLSEGGLEGAGAGALPRAHPEVRRGEPLLPRAARSQRGQAAGALAGDRGAAPLGAREHRQAFRARQDDPARAVDGRAERRRSGTDGRPRRLAPDAEGPRGAGAAGARRIGPAADARQPDAGKRDRHPGGAVADPEPRARGDVEDPARLLPARAAAADQARARRQRRARRGDGGAARQGDAGGAPGGGARRG